VALQDPAGGLAGGEPATLLDNTEFEAEEFPTHALLGYDEMSYVPESQSSFQCWHCRQQQQVADALTSPAQVWDDIERRAGIRAGGR
jgi:hypothetical protein